MIKFDSEIGSFEVPTSFAEISVEKFNMLKYYKDDDMNFMKVLTGAEPFQISLIDFSEIEPFIQFLNCVPSEEIEENNVIEFGEKIYLLPEDIFSFSWEQKIYFSRSVNEGNISKCVALYLQPLIGEKFDYKEVEAIATVLNQYSYESVFSNYLFLENQFARMMKMEQKKLKSNYTSEQIQAGIKSFDELAEFNTIDLIAGGNVLNYEGVLKIDYNTIFNKLLKLNLTTKFEEKYNSIMQSKQQ